MLIIFLILSFSISIKIASSKKMNDQQLMELALQGISKITEMNRIQPDVYYHLYYSYFEIGDDPRSIIDKKHVKNVEI